ncbi:hypothetical protein F4801DRAFT_29690 [Xylaria longipes]|nr:hypothetical protein F4801DRAFT_29690 [Xylaria longipes]
MNPKPPRPRMGARGLRKVRTGCLTCRIRHKKCDESRPACSRCSSTGRQCDFILPAQPHRSSSSEDDLQGGPSLTKSVSASFRPPAKSSNPVSCLESVRFEFFRLVCAPEYGVLFETPPWEALVLQSALSEPCIYHAALAVSALTWNHYAPASDWYDPETRAGSVAEYSTIQYNLAIRCLNARLGSAAPDRELIKLTILSAIVFINIEFLCRDHVSSSRGSFLATHLHGATCLLRDLKRGFGEQPDLDREYLEIGIVYIERQVEQLMIHENSFCL